MRNDGSNVVDVHFDLVEFQRLLNRCQFTLHAGDLYPLSIQLFLEFLCLSLKRGECPLANGIA